MKLTLKIILADLGLRKLTATDVWKIRKEIQQLYKRSAKIDPFADKKSEKEFAEIDWNIRYLQKMLYSLEYRKKVKEPAPSAKVSADS